MRSFRNHHSSKKNKKNHQYHHNKKQPSLVPEECEAISSFTTTPLGSSSSSLLISQQHERHVSFDTKRNAYYPSAAACFALNKAQRQALWYTEAQCQVCRQETLEAANILIAREINPPSNSNNNSNNFPYHYQSWGSALLRAYDGLETATGRNQIATIRACAQTNVMTLPHYVGLEKRVLLPVLANRQAKRLEILRHIQTLQRHTRSKMSPAVRAQRIAAVARFTSQPHRLYAQHLAQMAAQEYKQ